MTRDEILKIVNEVMDNYEFGTDGHRLYIKDNVLTFCSIMYDWYNIELKDNSAQEALRAIVEILMDWALEVNYYKEN